MQANKVLILDCADYDSVEDRINKVFEEFPLEWAGKNVLMKPNMLSARPPEQAVTTHPTIIKATTKWLLDAGAEVIVGDNSAATGRGENERCAQNSGIADAALGCYRNISNSGVAIDVKSRFTDKLVVSKEILDAEVLVSLPKFKTHALTQITGAIKNMFGILVGGEKPRMHAAAWGYKNFIEALVDIYQIRPPDLSIMDAVVGMEGNGPSAGYVRPIGKILASDNAVALDAVMVTMMGKRPEKIHLLKYAHERGLGEIDVSKLDIMGELKPLKHFRMPSTFLCHLAGGLANNKLARYIMDRKPAIISGECKSCGVCVESCPVKAMSMGKNIPEISYKDCIRCYCCQELCPSNAIELRRRGR